MRGIAVSRHASNLAPTSCVSMQRHRALSRPQLSLSSRTVAASSSAASAVSPSPSPSSSPLPSMTTTTTTAAASSSSRPASHSAASTSAPSSPFDVRDIPVVAGRFIIKIFFGGWRPESTATVALLAAVVPTPPHLSHLLSSSTAAAASALAALRSNHVFMAGFWAWAAAQVLKVFTKRWKKGYWDWGELAASGGMPSSHSALSVAVTAAAARTLGLASAVFAISLCYSLVVMYDAAGVRLHAGKQAEVLNTLLADVAREHPAAGRKLKEVLGHTPRQVAAGAALGLAVGIVLPIAGSPQVL